MWKEINRRSILKGVECLPADVNTFNGEEESMKILKLIGGGYLALGLLVMLVLFIHDCLANDKFVLHFIGIFLVIPAIAYCLWRLSEDTHMYIKEIGRHLKALWRFHHS
jgi:hypothetical protein